MAKWGSEFTALSTKFCSDVYASSSNIAWSSSPELILKCFVTKKIRMVTSSETKNELILLASSTYCVTGKDTPSSTGGHIPRMM